MKVCKIFEWWKLLKWRRLFEFEKSALFIMSQIPLHSCHLIWKDAMQLWKNIIWIMFKKQKTNCTGSMGTGSDPGRTRFLVNVITQNSKMTRRNRFPYRYNPVPGTNSREVFFAQVLEPGSLLGQNRFLKAYFQKFFWKWFQT